MIFFVTYRTYNNCSCYMYVSWFISAILCSAHISPWRITHFVSIITNLRLNLNTVWITLINFVSEETFSSLAYCNLTLRCVSQDIQDVSVLPDISLQTRKLMFLLQVLSLQASLGSSPGLCSQKKMGWEINVVQPPSLSIFCVCRVIHN